MIHYFLVLAVTGASLLLADFVLGILSSGEPRGPHAIWHGVHIVFSLLSVVALLGIHSIVYTYFMATGKWAKEVVRVYQMPEWYVHQAKRNKRLAFRFVMGSMIAIAISAWLGGAADTRGEVYALWHLGAAALTIAFNLVSFVGEYGIIVTHARLLLEVKSQADQLRAVRYGATDPAGAVAEA
jgi:hypothetical protein